MRLKDTDKLIELIDDDIASLDKNMSREGYDVCLCALKMAKQYIKALPTVEPIKRGRWIWNKRLGEWYCSNCDRIMNPYTVEKSEGVYEMAQPFYCGWCGAKMDGGENDI